MVDNWNVEATRLKSANFVGAAGQISVYQRCAKDMTMLLNGYEAAGGK